MGEQLQLLSVDSLHAAEWNRDIGDVDELVASIKDLGLIEPIVVRPNADGFQIVAGERRWTAAKMAGLTEIPTIIRELDDRQALEMQLIENLQRKDIAPLEEAEGYRRLVSFGVTQSVIAQKVNRSAGHVSKRIALLALPEKAREGIADGRISVDVALELKALKGLPDEVVDGVVESLGRGYYNVKALVKNAITDHIFEQKKEKALEKFAADGITVIDEPSHYGGTKARPIGKGYGSVDVKVVAHRKEPCHAGYVDRHGAAAWACTDPARHLPKGASTVKMSAASARDLRGLSSRAKSAKEKNEEKAFREATKARRAKLREIVGASVGKETAFELVARYALNRVLHDEAKLACDLLDLEPVEVNSGYGKHKDWRRALELFGERDATQLRRVLAAIEFARCESPLKVNASYGWRDAAPHFAFLKAQGYAGSEMERKLLAKHGAR